MKQTALTFVAFLAVLLSGVHAELTSGTNANGNATLQFQVVPEPQSWVIAFCGLTTLIALQRFRRTSGIRTR